MDFTQKGLGALHVAPAAGTPAYRPAATAPVYPPASNNAAFLPPVFDQGRLGSCSANAACALFEFSRIRDGERPVIRGSRLFNYWFARKRLGTQDRDSGTDIQSNFASLANEGICPEGLWPYSDANPGPFQTRPDAHATFSAHHHRGLAPHTVAQDAGTIKACLLERCPVEIGFTLYSSFYGSLSGDIPLPDPNADQFIGGHAVLVYDYLDDPAAPGGTWALFQNSWGTSWANGGRGRLPFAYLLNPALCWELWTVRAIAA